jgi:hypothetical protein
MFHLTVMGGADVRLKEPDNIVVTFWGGTEIKLPTLAEKIIRIGKAKQEGRELNDAIRRTNVITVMGGTSFKLPTIAQEVEEMFQLRDSAVFTAEELDELWQETIRQDTIDILETFTVMGGAGEELPSRKEEVAAFERLLMKGILLPEELADLKSLLQSASSAPVRALQVQEKLRSLLLPARRNPVFRPLLNFPERNLE